MVFGDIAGLAQSFKFIEHLFFIGVRAVGLVPVSEAYPSDVVAGCVLEVTGNFAGGGGACLDTFKEIALSESGGKRVLQFV